MWTEGGEEMTGAEIMKHRRKMNYTTDKLAQNVGVTAITVYNWEQGVTQPIEHYKVRLHVLLGLGHRFRRKLTDAQRLAQRKRRIELMMILDEKVDTPGKLGSWADLDDNDSDLLELKVDGE